jgi:hypothetical protein
MGRLLAFAFVLLLGAGPAAGPLDISGTPGAPPAGWKFQAFPADGMTAAVSSAGCRATAPCVLFTPATTRFARGSLSRVFDAAPYRGKRIRYRVYARMANEAYDGVGTSLTVHRAGDAPGYSERNSDRAVRGTAWGFTDIVADVASDADTITVGVQPSSRAASTAADPTIEIVGDAAPVVVAPPAALTGRERTNLVALARTLRVVRHFHASDQAAAAQWETFTVDAVRAVAPARDAAALAAAIGRAFAPVAPTMRVERASDAVPAPPPIDGATGTLHWVHVGFGHGSVAFGAYADQRTDGPLAAPNLVRVPLDGDYVADIPLTVATNGTSTLPAVAPAPPGTTADASDPRDRSVHLAGVIDEWEILKTFSPYLDTAAMPWDDVLPAMLSEAASDADESAYAETLQHVLHALRDGHGSVAGGAFPQRYQPDVTVTRVGDAIVVDRAGASTGVASGDVVTRIDGRPASAVWDGLAARLSGTDRWIAYNVALRVLSAFSPCAARADRAPRFHRDDRDAAARRAVGTGRRAPSRHRNRSAPRRDLRRSDECADERDRRTTPTACRRARHRLRHAGLSLNEPARPERVAVPHARDAAERALERAGHDAPRCSGFVEHRRPLGARAAGAVHRREARVHHRRPRDQLRGVDHGHRGGVPPR